MLYVELLKIKDSFQGQISSFPSLLDGVYFLDQL